MSTSSNQSASPLDESTGAVPSESDPETEPIEV